jgi:hypothetical protein
MEYNILDPFIVQNWKSYLEVRELVDKVGVLNHSNENNAPIFYIVWISEFPVLLKGVIIAILLSRFTFLFIEGFQSLLLVIFFSLGN